MDNIIVECGQKAYDELQIQQWMNELYNEIKKHYEYTDKNRKKYKTYVQIVNVTVSILYPLIALLVAMSFWENLQMYMNVLSLLLSAIGTMVPLISKGLAWNEKLQQRTIIYLKLDELMRDIRLEKSLDENSFNKYRQCFKEIVIMDNRMGLDNVVIMEQHSNNVLKESGKQ